MFKSKSIVTMAIVSILLVGGVGTYGVVKSNEAKGTFVESGYIIEGVEDTESGFVRYSFEEGNKLEYRYPDKIVFEDSEKVQVVTDANAFLHFNDGSVASLSQGVLVDLDNCNTSVLNYYNLSAGATLDFQGGSYLLEAQDASWYFEDFLWKIGENKYILVSDEIEITLADQQTLNYSGFVELKYYNEGILLILSEEGAYRTVSANCIATVENGVQIDLASRVVVNNETVAMSMEQMVIGSDDNIDILAPIKAVKGEAKVQQQQIQINLPTFEVIDGADGSDGTDGIQGSNGINGLNGKTGENGFMGMTGANGMVGTDGKDGVVGAEGLLGEDGIDGNQGSAGGAGAAGTPGTAGKAGASGASGANGATGAAGAQGLTGANGIAGSQGVQGNDGLNGDEVLEGKPSTEKEIVQLPVFAVDSLTPSSNGAEIRISITDGDVELAGTDDIIVKILNNATGREVRRLTLSSTDVGTLFDVPPIDNLAADTEYCVVVNANYIVNNGTYEKTFLRRVFTTSALGLTLTKSYVTEDSLAFTVTKSNYSGVQSASIVLADAAGSELTTKPLLFDANGIASVVFENDAAGTIKSNTVYRVYLKEVFDGTNTYNNIEQQEYRTLKKLPTLGAPVVVVDKQNAVFNMQLEGVKDEDNGIRFYRYELYRCNNNGDIILNSEPEKTLMISTNSLVSCDVTSAMKNVPYRVRVFASFFDNEKNVEVVTTADSNVFSMTNTGFPEVTYTAKTEPDSSIPGDTAITKHDRLVGTIQIATNIVNADGTTNYTRILVDEQHPITVFYKSGSGQIGQMAVTQRNQYRFDGADGSGTYDIPIDWSGLRANDNYVITVWAYTDLGEGADTSTVTDTSLGYSNVQIGTIIAQTPAPAGFKASFEQDKTASVGVTFSFSDLLDTEDAAYEASTVDRIEVRLYDGDKKNSANTATLVSSKVFYSDQILETQTSTASQRRSTFTTQSGTEKKSVLDGITVTEKDFENFTSSQLKQDQFTVEIAVVQDYTDYRNSFKLENNLVVFNKEAVPPTWDGTWASNGFEIIEIKNNETSLLSAEKDASHIISELPSDAVIGLKVTSKYDNSAGLATGFDYYAFKVKDDKNAGVTDADKFYQDIDTKTVQKIPCDATKGNKTVPSAIFWFTDMEGEGGKLTRGYEYYFSGRVNIENTLFPDDYNDSRPVMKSSKQTVKYLAPDFKFVQYHSDGNGTLVYHYWIEADDPAAISSTFSVTGGNCENKTITHSRTGDTEGVITITDIGNNKDVAVSCTVESLEGEDGSREVIKQVYKNRAGFDNIHYEVENQKGSNRLQFVLKSDSSVAAISRLTAIKVKVWAPLKQDLGTEEFILPLTVVTEDSATAYLNYSSISKYTGNTLQGEVTALYDTNVSGMKLAEDSELGEYLALQTVAETKSSSANYITLNTSHSDIGIGETKAKDSLFIVTKKANVIAKEISFAYASPLDSYYNQGVTKNPLTFSARMRGAILAGPNVVATFKQIRTKELECQGSSAVENGGSFKVGIENATPTVNLWLGNSYNIVTESERATVYFELSGHEKLLEDNKIFGGELYLELYEMKNNSRTTIISEKGSTFNPSYDYGGGIKRNVYYRLVNPDVPSADGTYLELDGLSADRTRYAFEIEGLAQDKQYAIHFYYLDTLGATPEACTKNYPLDYKNPVEDSYYMFSTLSSIVLYPSTAAASLKANAYNDKVMEFTFTSSTTSGFQVKYEFVKIDGTDEFGDNKYVTLLNSEQLRNADIIDNTTLITESTTVQFKVNPKLVTWDSDTKFLKYGDDEYFLKMTPVSPTDGTTELGSSQYVSLALEAGTEPFFNVVTTPGKDNVKFRITVVDNQRVLVNDSYKVVLKKNGETMDVVNTENLYETYNSKNSYTITAKCPQENDAITLEIYALSDLENVGTDEELTTDGTTYLVKSVTAEPLGDKPYDLGTMSVQNAGSNKAYLYFANSVGLEDSATCAIQSVLYSVTESATGSGKTYTHSFTLDAESENVRYLELLPTFESGKWYTVYVRFRNASNKTLEEATFSYKG